MAPTNRSYPVVLCSDRNMLGALHVAALTILNNFNGSKPIEFHLFHETLLQSDIDLLQKTLSASEKRWYLTAHKVDAKELKEFPTLMGSTATYLRLIAPDYFDCGRILYCDLDILCKVDVSPLFDLDLQGLPVGMVPEAPITACADPDLVALLGGKAKGSYYNAGVLAINCDRWKADNLTQECLRFLAENKVKLWDQSAVNYVIHGRIFPLPSIYNYRTNARENWPSLIKPNNGNGRLLHFIDYPKPWSTFGKVVHPLGKLWLNEYRKTAHYHTRAQVNPNSLSHIWSNRTGYKKALKDMLLFGLLNMGVLSWVKGM